MDKIDETRWELEHAIAECYSAGENAEQAFSAKDQAWSREAYTEAEERHREAVAAAAAYALAEIERTLAPVIGKADWHKGHGAASCPYKQLLAARARLVGPTSEKS